MLHEGSASTGGGASTTNLYYSTRNTIFVAEQASPLPPVLRGLRRGVVVGTHLAQAWSHPDRRAARQAVLDGWRDARAGRDGPRVRAGAELGPAGRPKRTATLGPSLHRFRSRPDRLPMLIAKWQRALPRKWPASQRHVRRPGEVRQLR